MAQTEKQWNEFQASLPAEERVSYLDYLKIAEPVKYDNLSGATLARLKADSLEVKATAIVDESTKIAGARTDSAAQKAAAVNAANALARLKAAEASFNVTTKAPVITTAGPILTTAGPVLTTAGPVLTTAGPNVVLTTSGPNVVLTTAGPGVVTTAGPGVVTTAGPGVVTTSGPNVVTTAGPGVVTTAGPNVVTTAGPGVVTTAAPSGFTYRATDGTPFTDQAAYVQYQKMLNDTSMAKKATDAAGLAERQSAYDLLYQQFNQYGLGSLVEPLKGLIQSGASPAEFAIRLRSDNSINPATGRPWNEAYKKRFSANDLRISKGLKAISEAEYLGLEDQYQSILRNAGLPESYWKRGDLGVQEGFTNFIANDVSAVELEDRVSTAQQRLIYANPEVSIALKNFYPDISNGDLLAYALDPTKGLEQIKRRITAAEIGSSAVQLGLATNVTDAEYLARYGVNKAQAQQGYRTAAEILPTASKLGEIYSKQGLGPYTQQTAEQEIFNVPGAAEAAAKRRKLSELETAAFSGRAGMGALARDRAGAF